MLPELQTERLVLSEVQLEDGPALQAFQTRPEQWRCQAMEPEEFADGASRVQQYFEHRGSGAERRLFVYVALDKSSDLLVGTVSLSRFHPTQASLGFSVATEYWGKGYATEMANRVIAFGFEALGLQRICAEVAIENIPCKRVLEKIGMRCEGMAPDCIWAQGRWWAEAKYAILQGEHKRDAHGASAAGASGTGDHTATMLPA